MIALYNPPPPVRRIPWPFPANQQTPSTPTKH
jgi:hypothetical protein